MTWRGIQNHKLHLLGIGEFLVHFRELSPLTFPNRSCHIWIAGIDGYRSAKRKCCRKRRNRCAKKLQKTNSKKPLHAWAIHHVGDNVPHPKRRKPTQILKAGVYITLTIAYTSGHVTFVYTVLRSVMTLTIQPVPATSVS